MRFYIEKANQKALDEVMEIMEEARRTTIPREWFVADDRTYVKAHIEQKETGFVLTARAAAGKSAGETAGFLMVHIPSCEDENHLGKHKKLAKEELLKIAYIDTAAVKSKYRGNHLQEIMIKKAEEMLEEAGFRHLFATVHPDNQYSLRNMEKLGYEIIDTAEKYGGLIRHIVYKTIE